VHAGLVESIAEVCPTAFINIISNPVNSLVPMAKEILTAAGVYNPKKLAGVTTLDIVRANTFASQMKGTKTTETYVPVIGGHSGLTILPLLSQTAPPVTFTDDEVDALSARIRDVSVFATSPCPAHGCRVLLELVSSALWHIAPV
jgi:malate/lactate dehydrogenase